MCTILATSRKSRTLANAHTDRFDVKRVLVVRRQNLAACECDTTVRATRCCRRDTRGFCYRGGCRRRRTVHAEAVVLVVVERAVRGVIIVVVVVIGVGVDVVVLVVVGTVVVLVNYAQTFRIGEELASHFAAASQAIRFDHVANLAFGADNVELVLDGGADNRATGGWMRVVYENSKSVDRYQVFASQVPRVINDLTPAPFLAKCSALRYCCMSCFDGNTLH